MPNSVDLVREELEALGHSTNLFDGPRGTVVSFDYIIEAGSHKGERVLVGVSFQEEGYPEYPPHWVHVTPRIPDGKEGGVVQEYTDNEGREWLAMSRPPGDIWDKLPTKHMASYKSEHLRRIWKDV